MPVFNTDQEKENFKNKLRGMYWENEAKEGDWYRFKYTKGWSFGQPQWNASGNPAAREFLKTLTRIDENGNVVREFSDEDIDKLRQRGGLSPSQLEKYNEILGRHQTEINDFFERHLNNDVQRIEDIVAELSAAGKTGVADYITSNTYIQMGLVDYNNHFPGGIEGVDRGGIVVEDGPMMKYLKGERVELGYGKVVQIRGEFGLEDYLNFYLNTLEGQDRPFGLIRRFSNILEEDGINNISLTQEDINFLLRDLEELLGNRYKAIISNSDNWGIRNLIQKAFAMLSQSPSFGQPVGLHFLPTCVNPDDWQESFTTAQVVSTIPIVLDLDGDGIETTHVQDGAYFDHDANGFAERTGWASVDDGLLAWDRNGDGIINDGKELFNDPSTFPQASNGFEVLAQLDDNQDGKIDFMDSVWNQLRIWQDYDGDGYSSADELRALSELGIASINTGYNDSTYVDPNGNEHRQVGSFTWADGTAGAATDVWFNTDNMYTIANEWLDVPENIAALPDLQGYGNIYDLQQAMVRDTSGQLKSLVESYMAETDPNVRNNLLDQILFKWIGSDGIDPGSRGPNVDARKLAVLENSLERHLWGQMVQIPMSMRRPY